ncbi:MAG: sulfite exporter TauE/SafE family protein [Clostridia bacterium]|nr:sulfite exporter TauE/SafE family protein [Clostridia bacterium]
MEILNYIFLVLIGAGAGFVQRVSGFGLGIFAMIFLPHIMSSHTDAATISSIFACVTATYNAICYRKDVEIKIALPMMCAALISIPIAVHFAAVIPGDIFKILLGVVLVALGIYFIFLNKNIKIAPTFTNGIIAGTLGGVLGGLFSTGGPPAVLYVSSATEKNITYFATIQFYFCFTNIYATTMRAINGIIHFDIIIYALIGITGCMLGDFAGRLVFNRLDSKKLKLIIYIGMLVSGIIMIV